MPVYSIAEGYIQAIAGQQHVWLKGRWTELSLRHGFSAVAFLHETTQCGPQHSSHWVLSLLTYLGPPPMNTE